MKCICCDRDFHEGEACPYCRFPLYEVVGNDYAGGLSQLNAFAELHRREYIEKLELGVVLYRWKDENGAIAEDSHSSQYFAKGSQLRSEDIWYPDALARIPDEKTITVRLSLRKGDVEQILPVEVPNLTEAELQYVGFHLEDQLKVRVLLKNASKSIQSEPVSVAIG